MGFFSNLFGGTKLRDPLEAQPELAELIASLKIMDGRLAQAMFQSTRGQWDLRTWVLELAADRYLMKMHPTQRAQVADSLVAQGEVGWLLVRGVWHMLEGWESRGSGSADTVTEDGATDLERGCTRAVRDLEAVASCDPGDPCPHTFLLRAARGLGDRDLGESAYARACALDPTGYEPRARYLGVISERWLGSFDEMLTHARTVAAQMPDGVDAASLPILAHYDRYSHLCIFDGDVKGAHLYLRDPQVQAEVRHALARSVDAPGHTQTPATMRIRHTAAVTLFHGGSFDAAREQILKVGDTFERDSWWQDNTDPERSYKKARSQLGIK
ncbi:hypothetical protein KKD52_17795 [Myxococcota bacterium]|jgi:hypothetical protein|nr:hypothetical protein [Myxococcota bacterium]MBU1412022.1 hypothetical protein [Myxococcota bacterium]MBU1512206.1 hypothetical protein [Myxococcota bacterium]PKN24734.1 MAG: hypothetical protein CVU65_10875 [Deltaproteobacteria bacterium HGW-Deltaproteobacteria-22]